ncbi:hypothetical protein DSM106972_086240 [Dulcicalothrix desertica PCC 7102]|uniref:Uncharacterized protein n=1 Tax=Dulcicalothrix desertica PCC 7102 TaxID=232991 RepID=A0A433URX7_9CYAN|nr:hypothetical protein [Dulcicalothrix desertica]RUS96601.1 hypothetical protein DSM106972_086240 [Dulcicalothrix desertica PCC 7102]TWH43854.1 hypothetical protein CAL7102_07602 [Dulcicalothrix desertica PCC 7102]
MYKDRKLEIYSCAVLNLTSISTCLITVASEDSFVNQADTLLAVEFEVTALILFKSTTTIDSGSQQQREISDVLADLV